MANVLAILIGATIAGGGLLHAFLLANGCAEPTAVATCILAVIATWAAAAASLDGGIAAVPMLAVAAGTVAFACGTAITTADVVAGAVVVAALTAVHQSGIGFRSKTTGTAVVAATAAVVAMNAGAWTGVGTAIGCLACLTAVVATTKPTATT